MSRPTRNIPDIVDRLTAASVEHEGRRYVRSAKARRIIGLSHSVHARWMKRGWVEALRFRVPRSVKATRGVVVAWPLDQTVRCVHERLSRKRGGWRPIEDDQLEQHVGRMSYAAIARRLGRSERVVTRRAGQLGLTLRNAQGLLTSGDAADLCGVRRQTINKWCAAGYLIYRKSPERRPVKLIHPADLLSCVRRRKRTWSEMSAGRRRRLEHVGSVRNDAVGRAA